MSAAKNAATPEATPDATPRAMPELPADAHKGTAGRALLVAGSRLMPGAAILAVRAALRAGAGLATLAALDRELLGLVPLAAPEALLADWSAEEFARTSLERELASRDDHARLAGPGLGRGARTRRVLEALLADRFEGPLVLDADALNELAELGPERLRARRGFTALLPHPGEAARLLGAPIPSDADGRRAAATELARRTGAAVVLKGRGSVIVHGERVFVNATGNPGMATGGSGDVLAGIAVAYLAAVAARQAPRDAGAPFGPLDALRGAVHVHGLAGDLAARELGTRALIASDLVEFLPAAQRSHASCSLPRSC